MLFDRCTIEMMKITILTLFPEYFQTPLRSSILHRAQEKNLLDFSVINIRDYAHDPHHITDDRPYGGGAGMVMKVEPIAEALEKLPVTANRYVILTSAKGNHFTQEKAQLFSEKEELIIICGHYEGVDERVSEHLIDEEIRIGDYVLTGGEPASLVIADAVSRLLPGVLGNEESLDFESHTVSGVGAHPQYTRPEVFQGWQVPPVLLQGNHKEIEKWRKEKQRKL